MKCALCKINDADKKNTHYLTDAVIRTGLNENGSNIREKGSYYNQSTGNFPSYEFQRKTSPERITKNLQREPTHKEIERSKKKIVFSVDDVFCSDCEKVFTAIESKFTSKYLDQFRRNQFTDRAIFTDYKSLKSFFLLQVWRCSVCNDTFIIDGETAEKLRLAIPHNDSINTSDLEEFPLSVTFLTIDDTNTLPQTATVHNVDAAINISEKTSCYVGLTNDRNPNVILMNDFIIQFYDNTSCIRYFDFHGLNDSRDYTGYLNMKADEGFIVKVLSDEQRKQFQQSFMLNDRVTPLLEATKEAFCGTWEHFIGNQPTDKITEEYINYLKKNFRTFNEEDIKNMTTAFF